MTVSISLFFLTCCRLLKVNGELDSFMSIKTSSGEVTALLPHNLCKAASCNMISVSAIADRTMNLTDTQILSYSYHDMSMRVSEKGISFHKGLGLGSQCLTEHMHAAYTYSSLNLTVHACVRGHAVCKAMVGASVSV